MGRKEIEEAQRVLDDKIRRLRRLQYLLASTKFEEMYKASSEKSMLENLIKEEQFERLESLVAEFETEPGYTELLQRARALKIFGYSRMSKSTLLSVLREHK